MATELTKEEFKAAIEGATPHDPLPGDGRQYYTGQDGTTYCEDTTDTLQTKYFAQKPGM